MPFAPTERLHYADSFLRSFEARALGAGMFSDKPSVVLDRSAFFPEGGGQLGDRGALVIAGRRVEIVDAQVDEAGVVHHLVAAPIEVGDGVDVTGEIDAARRRIHMALHTAQHVLSAAFVEVANVATVSARLGETACTIDLAGVAAEAVVGRAEDLANAIVDDDVEVKAFFPTADELAGLKLRRKSKVDENVRVVVIGDFDVSPCGGTHCSRSAQVGLVSVSGIERYKGGTRVTFSAGSRARRELGADAGTLRALSKELSCGPADVAPAIEKLRRELSSAREAFGRARGEIAVRLADELAGAAKGPFVIAVLEDAEMLRAVSSRITASEGRVALLAGKADDGLRISASRSSTSTFDCGAFLKEAARRAGGRGGGRAEHAEGKVPGGTDWVALARELAT
jgi:alanyl-tRNA synthetase